jgi:single-strand DNA-binding protein
MKNFKIPEINNVIISGNVIKDPSYRYTSKGIAVSNFPIAVKRTFRDKSGSEKESICIVGVVAWHKLADICMKNLGKGNSVIIEGELQSRNIVNDEKKLRIVEVKARQIQFLNDSKKSQGHIINEKSYGINEDDNKSIIEEKVKNESDMESRDNENDNPMEGEFDFGFRDVQI